MTIIRRDLAGHPRPAGQAGADPAREELEQASDSTLIGLISRGSAPAFAALFASSYVEVWWLASCHRTPGVDATGWITGIVRRRIDDALRGTARPGMDVAGPGSRPSYSELEMAALLRRPVGNLLRE